MKWIGNWIANLSIPSTYYRKPICWWIPNSYLNKRNFYHSICWNSVHISLPAFHDETKSASRMVCYFQTCRTLVYLLFPRPRNYFLPDLKQRNRPIPRPRPRLMPRLENRSRTRLRPTKTIHHCFSSKNNTTIKVFSWSPTETNLSYLNNNYMSMIF